MFPAVVCVLAVSACSTQEFSLPPVGASSGGERLPGKIIWHDLLTSDPGASQVFYSELFGWEYEPMPGGINYTLIRHHGELIGGMVDHTRLPGKLEHSQWVVAMSVVDIEQQAELVRVAGGTVLTPPTSLGERGRIAVVSDPGQALLALLETSGGDPSDASGTPGTGDFLWHELWTDKVGRSSRFYSSLAALDEEVLTLEGPDEAFEYRLFSGQDKPRFGVRPKPASEMSAMWVSYLRVADEAALNALLARVEPLGGEVLVPATVRPGGGMVAIIAGPSGAGVALQVWPEESSLRAQEDQK
jgi:predicted enzyme related to lactoylglutathione lyase